MASCYVASSKSCTEIVLSHRQLKVIPNDINDFVDLEELRLNNNRLILPPNEVYRFQKLESLSLEHNDLTLLPQEIGSLSQLRFLNTSFNPITCLPDSIAKLHKSQSPGALDDVMLTEGIPPPNTRSGKPEKAFTGCE